MEVRINMRVQALSDGKQYQICLLYTSLFLVKKDAAPRELLPNRTLQFGQKLLLSYSKSTDTDSLAAPGQEYNQPLSKPS